MKLSTKVLLLVLGVALGISALVIWVINVNVTRHETARANASISAAIQRYLIRLDERHGQIDDRVRAQVEDPNIRSWFQGADEGDESSIRHLRDDVFGHDLVRQQQRPAAFHVLLDVTGRTLFNAAPADDQLKAHLDGGHVKWPSQEVVEHERRVRQYVMTPQGLYLALGVPLRVQLNEKLPTHSYFAGFRIDDAWLRDQLLSGSETPDDAPLIGWFVEGDQVIASAASRRNAQSLPSFDPGLLHSVNPPAGTNELSQPQRLQFEAGGERFLGQAFTLAGTGNPPARLLLASSLDGALAPLRALRRQIVLITACAALAAVLAAQWVSRLLSKPVEQMVAATQRISQGRFDEPVNVQRNDELGTLAGALNEMAVGLKERQRLREEKVKRDHDLDVARRIQMGVLPSELPRVSGYDLASYAHPAEQTGGDIFDVVALDDDVTSAGPAIAILLADATGHGIGPALSVTQVRAMLRIGVRLGGSLRNVLDQMNRQLCADLGAGRFVTAFLGRLDPAAHRLDYDAAGQAPMLHYHAADQRAEWRDASVLPLGVMDELMPDAIETMQIEPGDVVALLTDGFYEYIGPGDAMFEKDRVADLVIAHHCRPAREILDAILAAVKDFARGCPQLDDMTAIIVKRIG